VWYDPDVNRLNYDDHGTLLGEFYDDDQILVVLKNGDFYLSNFDVNNHYEENILRIEKFEADKVWTAVLFDADNQGYPYIKRFLMEATKRKQNWLSDNPASKLVLLTDVVYPLIRVTYGGADEFRGSEDIDAEQFISVKGFKAKGKRISTWQIESITELEPVRFPEEPEEEPENAEDEEEDLDPDAGKSQQQVIDEMTGQLRLFPDED
jgi:topoisomerase-4 subunit A